MAYEFPTVATLCSHSALQIFHGARQENLGTLGVCTPERKTLYSSFPQASPDELVEVESFQEILNEDLQAQLNSENAILIPHGSFVEYVGAEKVMNSLSTPIFGNRDTLEWESDRNKELRWLKKAEIQVPDEYSSPEEIEGLAIVKFGGAKGGAGFFLAGSTEEFYEKIGDRSPEQATIQEWIAGTRYYPHYFYSPLDDRLEILGIDRRDESNVDEYYRWEKGPKSFVVVGNKPLAVRESLLPKLHRMGRRLVEVSQKMFPPGLMGPFCLETVCTDGLEFVTFEVSARIVAGTNLYPMGSPYSWYYYNEPMSTGRRIAREIRQAVRRDLLDKITS
ncbi:MAG: formate--phosphoribosylaminoimidazolecarboxamide ligase [Candidatus Acetothermia bacterium]